MQRYLFARVCLLFLLLRLLRKHLAVGCSPLILLPCRLLPTQLPELPAPWHRTVYRSANLRVSLQQRPHASTQHTTPSYLDVARDSMTKQGLDLGTVARGTFRVGAARCVHQQLHGSMQRLAPVHPIFLTQPLSLVSSNRLPATDLTSLCGCDSRRMETRGTHIKVRTLCAAVALSRFDLHLTDIARR